MAISGDRFYIGRTVDRRWKAEIKKSDKKVLFFSPYLTSRTAELVLQHADSAGAEVYTVFDISNFARGGSSLRTIRRLQRQNIPLFHLPELHAKILIIPTHCATIGSQNLTFAGTKNKEATWVTYDKGAVQEVLDAVAEWVTSRVEITVEMIEAAERTLAPLKEKFEKLRKEASEIEEEIFAEAARQRLDTPLRRARAYLPRLSKHGLVSKDVARRFVGWSAYWHGHPSGYPAYAPRHRKRLYGSLGRWSIDFGANTFVVSRALIRARKTLERQLRRISEGERVSLKRLRSLLALDVRRSVRNHAGAEYSSGYPTSDGHMVFGTQSIHVGKFVDLVLQEVPLKRIFRDVPGVLT